MTDAESPLRERPGVRSAPLWDRAGREWSAGRWTNKMEDPVCQRRGLRGESRSAARHKETPRPRRVSRGGRDLQDGRPPYGPMAAGVDAATEGSLKRSRTLGSSFFFFGGRTEGFSTHGAAQKDFPDGSPDAGTVRADAEKSVRPDAPREVGGPPREVGGPPREVSGPPREVGGPPREVGGPPREVGGPPREVGGPPREVGGPPREVGGPPREVGGPPREVGGPPREVGGPSPRLGAFLPKVLWLTMTGCLSLRWPPCPPLERRRQQNALCPARPDDQSRGSESREGSESSPHTGDAVSVDNSKEDARRRASHSLRASRHGMACWSSTSRLPRGRQTSGLVMEKDVLLEVELVGVGDGLGDPGYWAEWRLSERNQELARGLWLPSHPFED
ncbi:unnamed protein product [Arctogadus glacialis]